MTDLIERLRDPKERVYPDDLMDEAADRIEELQVELKATQDNEHRIVEASKLNLIRIAELEWSINQLQRVNLANSELIEQLEDRRKIQDELLTDKCDELKAATLRIEQLEDAIYDALPCLAEYDTEVAAICEALLAEDRE